MTGKIQFIYHRIGHHADHSGYDQLVRYVPHVASRRTWFKKLVELGGGGWMDRRMQGVPLAWYSKERFSAEVETAGSFMTTMNSLYHYLYGEDSFYFLGKLPNWGRNRIVVSYHQPPSYFPKAVLNMEHIRKAHAVIALSRAQGAFFSGLLGVDRVFHVPHGVDTTFFCPTTRLKNGDVKRCLFVGHWLRDMEMLRRVIDAFQSRGMDSIRFAIVTFEKFFDQFKGFRQVDLYSGISEGELLNLYQTSDLLFLPLQDCTANNTILEAMACGLPVVTTDVGGIRDYADEKSAVLLPRGDVDAAVEVLSSILWDGERLESLSQHARRQAMAFGWPLVAAKMADVYEKIMA